MIARLPYIFVLTSWYIVFASRLFLLVSRILKNLQSLVFEWLSQYLACEDSDTFGND